MDQNLRDKTVLGVLNYRMCLFCVWLWI